MNEGGSSFVAGRSGRMVRRRPPCLPIARVFSGNADRDNLLALSQMALGVPCTDDVVEGWYEMSHRYLEWLRIGRLRVEWDVLWPCTSEGDE